MNNICKTGIFAILLAIAAIPVSAQTYKIRQRTSISGQEMESTIYVKGPRKRTEGGGMMGIGADVATIEQCDLKQNVKLNDKKKQYFTTPMGNGAAESAGPAPKSGVSSPAKATRGGTVTVTSSIIDTGERKQMFGLTARHVKTSMKMESSPDACSRSNMQMETDGWYVDLPQFSCPVGGSASIPYQRPVKSGCQDKMVFRESGGGKLGFPLQLTNNMDSGGGQGMTQTIDTIEFSKATLEDSLFIVPAGYTLAKQEQDLYGRPDFLAIPRVRNDSDDDGKPSPSTTKPRSPYSGVPVALTKRPGVKRIGVFAPVNGSEENVSTSNLQAYLVRQLTSGNVDAVAVTSEADARAAGCDYLLTSNFSKLKQSSASKVGGLFGKITNTDTSAAKTWDVQVDYSLVTIADGRSVLKNKAAAKTGGEADRVAESVLAMEASAVLGVAK